MGFEQVKGNETVKALLRSTLASGRVAHAYILEGYRGVGRTAMAKAFAAELLEVREPENSPDFTVVTNQLYDPDKKSTEVLIDTVRKMKRDVYIRPYAGDWKVYVIPGADTMQAPAQNSLLKVLEEPPDYCVIILLAENANAFLPTILSRAQILRLHPLEQSQVADYLVQERGLEPGRAAELAVMSGGAIGKALELLEDKTAADLREAVLGHMQELVQGDARAMYDLLRFLKQNKDSIEFILEILLSWSRDLMLLKLGGGAVQVINTDKEPQLRNFASRLTRASAFRFSEITVQYREYLAQNANFNAAMLCMVTEYWEEIHGRNHRS